MDASARKIHEQGVALFHKGKPDAALEKFQEAIQQADDEQQRAEIYNDMGATYKQLADYEAAHQALDEAMRRFEALGDQKGQAQTLGNRASIYEAQGQLEEAVETYKRSAKMLEDVGESEMAMYVWQAVSKLRLKQKQYVAAIGAYEEGVENMPDRSFKKKLMRGLLNMPGKMLGGGATGGDSEEEG